MRIFITGASGWIGSAAITELLKAGHEVVGLARSDTAADAITTLGAQVQRGDLNDLDSLRTAAANSEGVVHLGFNHDFAQPEAAAQTDRAATTALATALEGTNHPLVLASGVIGLAPGRVATEQDEPNPALHPRIANLQTALTYAERGVRVSSIRFAPTVHGNGDHGFLAVLVAIAREKGISAYIGEGASRWPAVHRLDAASLIRLAVDKAPAGAALHAVAEEGVPTKEIAEAIGRGLDLPVVSVPEEKAAGHFGWMARFFGIDSPASSTATRQQYGWNPTQPGLITDLNAGHYFH